MYSIDMGRKMCDIEIKYGSEGNFKPMVNILTTTENFTLLEIGCSDSIANFIVYNFKLDMVEAPWMYDPSGEITKIIKSNKKCLTFSHEHKPHVEYLANQTKQEAETSPKWEFGTLNKS